MPKRKRVEKSYSPPSTPITPNTPRTPKSNKKICNPLTPGSLAFAELLQRCDEEQKKGFNNQKFISCFPDGVDMDNIAERLKDIGCIYSFNCTSGDDVKLFKLGYTENLPQRVKSLCSKFNLSNIKFEKLTTVSGQSVGRSVHKAIQQVMPCLNSVNNKPSTEFYHVSPSKTVHKLSNKFMKVLVGSGKGEFVFRNEP